MEYGVYLESSIVDLKPRVLDFLTAIVEKAKQAKDYAISFKKKELAEITGKDIRTTARYLKALEEKSIITSKGIRGRSGGTVIMFNTDLIRFETSDKALINTDEPVSIDEIAKQKLPKKPQEPKKKSRNRRTKQQMVEAAVLNDVRQSYNDNLNDKVEKLGGTPNWEWFKETEEPVRNYRTYLLTRLYNRYAVLFTDQHNREVTGGLIGGNKVQRIANDYDVLPERFFGSSRWQQFEKFHDFCEENGIDPAVYLSAQFNRSVFISGVKKIKQALPFTNALISDSSYDVFKQYCDHQKRSGTYKTYYQIPAMFSEDFVIRTLQDGYETAEQELGLFQYRYCIEDFLEGVGAGEKEDTLVNFYDYVSEDLRKKVSFKTRNTLKKYIITQAMTLTGGAATLPEHLILSFDTTRLMLASIGTPDMAKDDIDKARAHALGMLIYPAVSRDEQIYRGFNLLEQMATLNETPAVIRLIMERKGLHISLADLRNAFKEYGNEKIPVDDFSMLDVDQIIKVMSNSATGDVDLTQYTMKREWSLESSIANKDDLEDALSEYLNSTQ